MDTVVLKFGGSSVENNIKLNSVSQKIRKFYDKNLRIVVVVSAQGKTTDNLIKEALSLSDMPNERELDVLLSSGEQMSMSKLAILLSSLNMPAISLTGWQAGIYTNNTNQNAIIENIDVTRINEELNKGKIVIVAGFQGINSSLDITTLGRGGSDTTAVALAAKLKASKCYIFSDVDGVYSTDPRIVSNAKKINNLSYSEMLDVSSEGAKVLHNRCVEVAEKFAVEIVAKSTFVESEGTLINSKIEESIIKNIVKNDNIKYVELYNTNEKIINYICKKMIENKVEIQNIFNNKILSFVISNVNITKFLNILQDVSKDIKVHYDDISKISIIGNGLLGNEYVLKEIINIIQKNELKILNMQILENKIVLIFKEKISDNILNELHKKLIK